MRVYLFFPGTYPGSAGSSSLQPVHIMKQAKINRRSELQTFIAVDLTLKNKIFEEKYAPLYNPNHPCKPCQPCQPYLFRLFAFPTFSRTHLTPFRTIITNINLVPAF